MVLARSTTMDDQVALDYESSLSDLTANSKPLITMLTMLADENKTHAAAIVGVIEKYVMKSPPKIKLPSLYLIDSIVKNVGAPYVELFTEQIIKIFANVFEQGDEKVRMLLFKLRVTWKGIFPSKKLYVLDITIKSLDPNWPIDSQIEKARAAPPIHLNPKFFGRQKDSDDKSLAAESSENRPESEKSSKREYGSVLKPNTDPRSAAPAKLTDPRSRKKEPAEKHTGSKKPSKQQDKPDKSKRTDSSKTSSNTRSSKSTQKKSEKKSSKRSSSSIDPSVTEVMKPQIELADKEAAAILTGDIDLRLLEPHSKKRKESEEPPVDFPRADVDLRIRPTGCTNDPGMVVLPNTPVVEEDDSPQPWVVPPVNVTAAPFIAPQEVILPGLNLLPMMGHAADQPVDLYPNVLMINDTKPLNGGPRKPVKLSEPAPDNGQIRLDGQMREVRFVDGVAIAILEEIPPNFVKARQIMFRGGTKKIVINDNHHVLAAFDGREHEFILNGNRHRIRFGAPLRELYVDGVPYSCQFNGVPVYIRSRDDVFSVTLHPPCPSVNDKLDATADLLAKLNLKPIEAAQFSMGVPNTPFGLQPQTPMNCGPNSGGWIRYQDEGFRESMAPGIFSHAPGVGAPSHPGFLPGAGVFCPAGMPGIPPFTTFPAGVPIVQPNMQCSMNQAAPTAPQMNVSDLLSRLVTAGIIGKDDDKKPKESAPGAEGMVDAPIRERIPKFTLKQPEALKKRYNGVITALHEGAQCTTCGQRFKQSDKQSDRYAQHLDWHFRTARREREGMKKASSRKWFYNITDWVQFEEVEDVEDRARSYFEIQEVSPIGIKQEVKAEMPEEIPTVAAKNVDQGDNTCALCHEAFDLFFCEDSEEWRLRNAVHHENEVFHPLCLKDILKPIAEPVKEEPPEEPEPMEQDEPKEDLTTTTTPTTEEMESEIKKEPIAYDENSRSLPGLDLCPSPQPEEIKDEPEETPVPEDEKVEDVAENLVEEQPEELDENQVEATAANDTILASEQSVIVEELGVFGVESFPETIDQASQDSKAASESQHGTVDADVANEDSQDRVVLKGSGGFVLKVKQDSVLTAEQKNQMDASVLEESELQEDDEWSPPTPDPAFKSFPTVKKGSEESGLCSIM